MASFSKPASAQVLIAPDLELYTSQAAYSANSTSIVDNITFNGLTTQGGFTEYPTLTVGGVSFTTPEATDLFVVGPGYTNPDTGASFNFPGDGTSTLFTQSTTATDPAVLTATLPTNASPLPGVTAVGSNLGAGFSTGVITATITLVGNPTPIVYQYSSANASSSGLGFLGFTTTDGSVISSITYSDSTVDFTGVPDFAVDNFTYGVADVAAPEPASLGLLAAGLIGLALLRRRVRSCC